MAIGILCTIPPGSSKPSTGLHVVVPATASTVHGAGISSVAVAWAVVTPPTVFPDMLLMRHPLSAMEPTAAKATDVKRRRTSTMAPLPSDDGRYRQRGGAPLR